MTRIVLDTNLVVSALLSPEGKPATILKMVLNGEIDLVLSPAILKEISLVLNYDRIVALFTKRSVTREKVRDALEKIARTAIIVPGEADIHPIDKDPSDNMFLSCALEGKADFIISGDRHLTDLVSFEGISIVNSDTFLRLIKKGS